MKFLSTTSFFTVSVLFLFITVTDVSAQKKDDRKEEKRTQAESDNSFAPASPEVDFERGYVQKKTRRKRLFGRKKARSTYRYDFLNSLDKKKEEFYARIKQNAKEDRKIARKMQKPQYSDPSYFGHKRKPKKRPVGKRKLCKECGIIH